MTPRPFSSLGLLFDLALTAAVVIAVYATVYTAFAVSNAPVVPPPTHQQSDLACTHHQATGHPYKCGRA